MKRLNENPKETNDPPMSNDLKQILFPGRIHLIETDQQLIEAFRRLKSVTEFGFDTETRPSFRKGESHPVSLLQLATDTDAYLLRLRALTVFNPIQEILEDKSILKVGAAIRDDLKGLQKIFQFTAGNFIELQTVAKEKGLKNLGLKGMTEEVLQARLSKSSKLTNWDSRTLTHQQLQYAATDAWIGLHLFKIISQR